MGSGSGVPWAEGYQVAKEVAAYLAPYVVRAKCVGSVRRRRPTVSDVEFVAEPFMQADLLGDKTPDLPPIWRACADLGTVAKQGERYVQVVNVFGHAGLKLDLFLVHPPAQWGSLVAIRTGPAALSRLCVTRMRDLGMKHTDGRVVSVATGETVPTPTERDFFEVAGVPYVPPARRDKLLERHTGGGP